MSLNKQLIAGLILGIAGFAGNWFKYPLFLNIDFLFGSLFVMIALLRYGTGAGIIASIVASSCTFLMWKHPYAMVIFTAETAVVGFLNRRRSKADILLHDIGYWFIIGTPLVWLFYNGVLHDSFSSTILIALKQSMNGISNALLAYIFFMIIASREKVAEHLPSFSQVFFTTVVTMVLVPAFLYIFYSLRSTSEREGALLASQTKRASDNVALTVSSWLQEHHQIVTALAHRIGDQDRKSVNEMQQLVETFNDASHALWAVGVIDKHATSIAFSPRVDAFGHSTIGISYADRSYLSSLKENRKPYIAGVLQGKSGNKGPVVPLLAPMFAGNEFKGYCFGALQTDAMLKHIKIIVGTVKMDITLLDQFGQVVVSTRKDLPTMSGYSRPPGGSIRQINRDVIQWIPRHETGKNLMQRWSKSLYISEKEIDPASHWKVIVENSYFPLLEQLRSKAATALAGLVFLSLCIVVITTLLGRRLTRSLEKLRFSTGSLPEDIRSNRPAMLPESSIREIAGLIDNFRITRTALQEQHDSLQNLNDSLNEKNAFLSESEERYRILVEVAPFAVFVNRNDSIEYVNPTALALFGADSAGQLLGRSPFSLFHPEYHPIMTARINKLMSAQTVPLIEARIVQLNGTVRNVEVAAASFVDSKGVAIHVMLHDITERKHNEEKLRSVLTRFSEAQKAASAGLWDWDIPTGRLTWSPELYELFGLDPEQVQASFEVWQGVMHPEDWAVADQRVKKALEKKERLYNEYRTFTPSGELRWISAIGDTIYDDSEKPVRMSGICIDITERKQAEERLNLLADTANVLLVTDSPQNAVEALCLKALSILGCQCFFNFLIDQDSGRLKLNACTGITDEDQEKIQWLDLGVAVCGCTAQDACRIVAEDIPNTPDERTELINSFGIRAYACHPLMFGPEVIGTLSFGTRTRSSFSDEDLAVMKAISDLVAIAMQRKRIEGSLERAKKEWERTFDSVPDLIAILDDKHRIIRVNRSMAKQLNREPKDCIGLLCHEAIHGTLCPPAFCPQTHTLCDNLTHEVEIYEESLGGDYLISTTPLHDAAGNLIGTVHVARDISDRKSAEDALKKAHDTLEERIRERTSQLEETVEILQEEVRDRIKAEKALGLESEERIKAVERLREQEKFMILQSRHAAMGEMIGNIAHQWRQPLNILGLLIQQMQMYHEVGQFDTDYLDQSVRKGMEIIQHMSRTIDDFRDFFRPDKEPVVFSVSDSIEKAISLVRESFASNLVSIDSRIDCEPVTMGYPNEFSQVLLNILINARDVLLERKVIDPRITINVGTKDCRCIIKISDNAGGITDNVIGKVFDPYFTTKGVQQGTGLGLYMAKTIIEKNMNGLLTVANGPEGAEFQIEVESVVP